MDRQSEGLMTQVTLIIGTFDLAFSTTLVKQYLFSATYTLEF